MSPRSTFPLIAIAACMFDLLACGTPSPARSSSPADAPASGATGQANAPVAAAVGAAEQGALGPSPGTWQRRDDAIWVRSGAGKASSLVVEGILSPTTVTEGFGPCDEMLGARPSGKPLKLHVDGERRKLYVFVRARGPIGVNVADTGMGCATAGPNAWAKLEIEGASGEISVEIADIDFANERRGQTSPYVLVVSDDDVEPSNTPAPRAAVSPNDAVVRWAIDPVRCKDAMDTRSCFRASIELSGAVKKTVALKEPLVGQVDCWPRGTGAVCGGPSGYTEISLDLGKNGVVKVLETSTSDGYCPPPEDCSSHRTLTTFKIPAGVALVPDPAGTWPPAK